MIRNRRLVPEGGVEGWRCREKGLYMNTLSTTTHSIATGKNCLLDLDLKEECISSFVLCEENSTLGLLQYSKCSNYKDVQIRDRGMDTNISIWLMSDAS